jgi:hypothetical protein
MVASELYEVALLQHFPVLCSTRALTARSDNGDHFEVRLNAVVTLRSSPLPPLYCSKKPCTICRSGTMVQGVDTEIGKHDSVLMDYRTTTMVPLRVPSPAMSRTTA